MKRFLMIFGIVVAVLAVVALGIGLYCGPIVKIGIEKIGPKVTQVSINVDTVSVSLLTGSAQVKSLIVGNPAGYSSAQAINVGNITISMDPLSVLSNKIVVHSVHVESPEITFQTGTGGNNLSKIMSNVNAAPKNSANDSNNKPASNIEVDDFLITGAKLHMILPGLGSKEIPLPDIHLTNLGKGSNGLTPVQLTGAVLAAILKVTVSTVAGSAKDLSQGVENLGKSATKTVGSSVSTITNSIGGLFGK